MGERRNYLINEIVKYCQKLDAKGFGANHDGNISAIFDGSLLATPTAVSKGNVVADMIITLDMQGNKLSGIGKPFSEISLHLAAYRSRNDAQAVVHAHPPYSSALGLVGLSLQPQLPEAIVSIGDIIPVVEFAMPGAPENATIIEQAFLQSDVIMLPGNGVMAIGDNVEQAYLRLELVEHVAKMQFIAEKMGMPRQLSMTEKEQLLKKRIAAGLGPQARGYSVVEAANNVEQHSENVDVINDSIKQLIAAEVRKILS